MITQVRAKQLFIMKTIDKVKQLCWRIEGEYYAPTGEEINVDGELHTRSLVTQIYLTGRPPFTPTLPKRVYRMDNGKYRVLVSRNGKMYHIGYYNTLEDAESVAA